MPANGLLVCLLRFRWAPAAEVHDVVCSAYLPADLPVLVATAFCAAVYVAAIEGNAASVL